MEKIIDPVAVELIEAELTPARKLMDTNKGGNELYVVDCHNAPNTLREIGACGRPPTAKPADAPGTRSTSTNTIPWTSRTPSSSSGTPTPMLSSAATVSF